MTHALMFWGGRISLSMQWEPRDIWVGAYWDLRYDAIMRTHDAWLTMRKLYIWICPVPTVVLCVSVPWPFNKETWE